MGLLDLSTSASSRKHVDFSDARYQLADKLRQSGKKSIRATFTLYDNKEYNKTAVQEISAAYELSDKKLPMGELLNKMLDLILDMEDGKLDTERDAVYAWKYSMALLDMYDDKVKRREPLSTFDNGLKTSIIGSETFMKRFPGKYTSRTNFFDQKIKSALVTDIVSVFKEEALPKIHDSAIRQSHETAEKHNNPILDKIVRWAVDNYNCTAESFFEVQKNEETGLHYSANTIILHLKNGYDMSIIGYAGTDNDDKFAISIFDAQTTEISNYQDRISQKDVEDALSDASENTPVDPLSKLLSMEKKKNDVLKKQYDTLANIRPMIPASALALQAAESVVGEDYIWGCKQFRLTHAELPKDFKLEDVKLPTLDELEEDELKNQKELAEEFGKMATLDIEAIGNADEVIETEEPVVESEIVETNNNATKSTLLSDNVVERAPSGAKIMHSDELLKQSAPVESLFTIQQNPSDDPSRVVIEKDRLNAIHGIFSDKAKPKKAFDPKSTLLPGFTPIVKPKQEDDGPSITKQATQPPKFEDNSLWKDDNNAKTHEAQGEAKKKDIEQNNPKSVEPELILDDIDSLFA